ncbi:hypothetical protein PPL_00712 [Heterostelium album PN500]|uniref:EF-hand domain-containing protein n=1 Tax=Heterostelium pallidum (strain ATCC 26659 / Pp 5 / PN500) TaxID=670386 RepID=D3AX81_HETP5|nr:hypothetical protein PPL_00712 [Heterostelium album PN500]EFA86150.1 hypothetical protein PPL_00712 [Heterostelium album PN500]|eukprot:XP_020438255.1 hypothetical protein PPL_00712 [Heterostelium album PN500]
MDMEEVQLDGSNNNNNNNNNNNSGGGNSGNINTSMNTTPVLSSSNVNEQFIGQMEQVFKAIDKGSTGVISLSQLRSEIEELGADIDDNPLIGQLIQYLRHVHAAAATDADDGNELSSSTNEEDILIDFESFVSSMTHFVEGVDPKESRRLREERLKLPRFKVPVELLKKYNVQCSEAGDSVRPIPNAVHQVELRQRDTKEQAADETKFIDGMRDTNKELVVQNTTLKTQITKMNSNDAALRDNIENEKERVRNMEEQMILKDLEIKKLNHQIKTQQNINSKLSMMVSFVNEPEKEKDTKTDSSSGSKFNKSKTLKITNREKGKPALTKQKSDFFDAPVNRISSPTLESHQSHNISVESLRASLQADSLQKEFELLKQDQSFSELDQLKLQVQSFGEELSLSSFQPEPEPIADVINEQTTTTTAPTPTITPSLSNSNIAANTSTSSLSNTPMQSSVNVTTTAATTVTVTSPSTSTPSTATPTSQTTSNSTPNSEKPTPIVEPPSPIAIPTPNQSVQTPLRLSSPFIQTPPSGSPRTILTSPGYVRQSSPAITDRANLNSSSHSPVAYVATSSPSSTGTSNNNNNNVNNNPPAINTLELPTLSPNFQSNPNVGSIKRMKKSDLIRLQMTELEAHKESAQNLIDETTTALSNLYKNKDNELQRMQKMYNEEKQANKYLEKQLTAQLEKNKELIAGKEKNSWGDRDNII